MGKTYDIPDVGIMKLSDFEHTVTRMSSTALKSLSNQSLPDPIMAVIKDELNKRGKKKGGLIVKPFKGGNRDI